MDRMQSSLIVSRPLRSHSRFHCVAGVVAANLMPTVELTAAQRLDPRISRAVVAEQNV
jgi:hypothetical protein